MNAKLKKGGASTVDARAPSMSPSKALFKGTGTMIMKSVSIFLASGRRASSNRASQSESVAAGNEKRRKNKNSNKMEDASGKINPKLLESLKKKTHFNKYYFFLTI